jgi:uracil-DNA glycosylase
LGSKLTHTPLPPFAATHGPRDAKVVLVGESWGVEEAKVRKPFIGSSGQELARMLTQSGLGPSLPKKPWLSAQEMINYWKKTGFLITNVCALRPPDNKFEALCSSKKELPNGYPLPAVSQGKYLQPEYLPELERLCEELSAFPRNLIIPLGAIATWATLGSGAISSVRGVVHGTKFGKLLPTYHPSAVLRNWSLRPIVLMDLLKAQRELEFPEIRRPSRQLLINPTLAEAHAWTEETLNVYRTISFDIETANKQITCIGFATSLDRALSLPFTDHRTTDGSYWPSQDSEVHAWQIVRRLLESPLVKIAQNGLYDLQYLVRMGFRPQNCIADTMLLHHALYPELQKGLGFLGSLYVDEGAWKMVHKHKEGLKRDE